MFLTIIWSSLCFSISMYRFIPSFGRSGTTWFKWSCLRASHRHNHSLSKSLSVHLKLPRFLLLVFFFRSAALVCFLVAVPLLPFPFCCTSFKKKNEQQKNIISLRFERNSKHGCLNIALVTFTRTQTEVNFSSADWLRYLRTQMNVSVGGVCLWSKKIFSAPFSRNDFFTKRIHFKEYKSKKIRLIALKFGQ